MRRIAVAAVVVALLSGCFLPVGTPTDGSVPDASTDTPPTASLASTDVALGDSASVTLTASDADGDELEWSFEIASTPEGSAVTSLTVDGVVASFTPDVVGAYVIKVTVSDGTDSVTASTTVNVISRAPGAPQNPSPADSAANVDPAVILDWSDVTGATAYDIYFGAGVLPDSPAATVSTSAYTPESLEYSTTYVWKVVAKNSGGTATAGPWSFTTIVAAPDKPSGPVPADGSTDVTLPLTLEWGAAAGASTYDVYLGARGAPSLIASGLTKTTYAPSSLSYNTTYTWYVVARNDGGSTTGPTWTFATETNDTASGLIAHWKFTASLADSTTYGHNGVWYSGLDPATGGKLYDTYGTDRHQDVRSTILLTGSNSQYIQIPLSDLGSDPLNNQTDGFSISFWYRDGGSNDGSVLFSKVDTKGNGYVITLAGDGSITLVSQNEKVATVDAAALGNEWNHVAISWDFSNKRLRIWANDTLRVDTTQSAFANAVIDLYLGGTPDGKDFTGALDDVRIYSRAISDAEATSLYNE